jgi:Flp pilus assembly CpaF family ATPase
MVSIKLSAFNLFKEQLKELIRMETKHTYELVNELVNREGVEEIIVNPYETINIGDKMVIGMARILVITD